MKQILWGVLHDASSVPADALSLRLQMTPVKREKARSLFFDVLFNYEVLLRYERHATSTGGQPYIVCAMSA